MSGGLLGVVHEVPAGLLCSRGRGHSEDSVSGGLLGEVRGVGGVWS